MGSRDTSQDGWRNRLEFYILSRFAWFWRLVDSIPWIHLRVNRLLINRAINKTKPRPHQFSCLADYTSWDSLTDRSYTGRHLGPAKAEYIDSLPPVEQVVKLFRRSEQGIRLSNKSTLLFSHFAQWFTDGFLRTNRSDGRKNTSNHDIDLSPLYGIRRQDTLSLRSLSDGLLKSQIVNGEEYPPYYFDASGTPLPEFADLPIFFPTELPAAQRSKLFAMGVERANNQIGYVMLNTLFLREHNRICKLLKKEYSDWDDEHVFQIARNINIVLLIKLVVEEYINHITPYYFKFRADPSAFWHAPWYRTNWMTAEFNLLYRWHSLVTDEVNCDDEHVPLLNTLFNNDLLMQRGLAAWFHDASTQTAGEIGLFNTPLALLETEAASIRLGRALCLQPYNQYRVAFGYPPLTRFEQISGRSDVQKALRDLYGSIDRVEFYVGLFAEDVRDRSALSPLIGRMVGVDAFSQALTNALLSIHVYNESTFSRIGWEILRDTQTLRDIVERNVPGSTPALVVTFTLPGRAVE